MSKLNQSRNEQRRNVGISAHVDAGKTTLTERMLYYCGDIHQMREVHGSDGGAFMDSDPIEKRRGITIASAATTIHWTGHQLNLIDTPGHVDFTVEVERSLRVLDGAVLVLCSVSGVQSQTMTVDRQMKHYRIPRIALINKMDRTGADPWRVIDQLDQRLNARPIALQIPIGQEDSFCGVVNLVTQQAIYFHGKDGALVRKEPVPDSLRDAATQSRRLMLESLAEHSDVILEELLCGKEPSVQQIRDALRCATLQREITPVLFASAYKNCGVQEVLDAICHYLPSPQEREVTAHEQVDHSDDYTKRVLSCQKDDQVVAMAFKTIIEPFGQLTYMRVYQGSFKKGDSLKNVRSGKSTRFARLVQVHSDQRKEIDSATAGDIVAVVGIECASGDTFVGPGPDLMLENISVDAPVVRLSVEPIHRKDMEKLCRAMDRFRRQDPTFHYSTDPDSGELQIAGMGQLHLDVYIERLREECECPVVVGVPTVTYRERPTAAVTFSHRFKKQNGGQGLFAQIEGRMEPLPATANESLVFVDTIRGGRLSAGFIRAVHQGVQEAMRKGPIGGYEFTGVKFTLVDGMQHEKDSSELAFQLCAAEAMREIVFARCQPQLLEPMMKLEIIVPCDLQGPVIAQLAQMRGVVRSTQIEMHSCTIAAEAPLAELFDYADDLRSITQGKGSFSMQPSHYAPAIAGSHRDAG